MDAKDIVSDLKGLKKEHMISEVKTAFDVAMFKKDVMAHVASDVQKTKFGYYIIAVGAILGFAGMQLFGSWLRPTLVSGLVSTVIQAVMAVVGLYVVSFIAQKLFKGAATHDQFFRVAAYGMILTWASIIPAVGMIVGIWGLAVFFVILKTIHKLTTGGAIGTIIVTMVVFMVLSTVLASVGLGAGMMGGRLGGGSFGGGSSSFGNMGSKGFNFNIKGDDGKSGSVQFDENGNMKIVTPEGEMNINATE